MKISEERIKWVLRDYEGVLKYCDARYENYHRSYICEKQELQNFVLPQIDFAPRSSSGGEKRDLSDLYERWTERQKKFQKELIDLMFEVEKEREEIHRVWLCFQMLPKKEYEILQKLYVEKHPYKEVELDSGISHRAFERNRKHAIELIQNAYESKWKKEKLLVYAKNEKEHRQQKIEEEPYQQIDLSNFIDTGKNHVPDFGTNEG